MINDPFLSHTLAAVAGHYFAILAHRVSPNRAVKREEALPGLAELVTGS